MNGCHDVNLLVDIIVDGRKTGELCNNNTHPEAIKEPAEVACEAGADAVRGTGADAVTETYVETVRETGAEIGQGSIICRDAARLKIVVAITGARKTGKTFLTRMISHNLARKGRRSALVDFTMNRALYGHYCWGKHDLSGRRFLNDDEGGFDALCRDENRPFVLDESRILYTSASLPCREFNFLNMLELASEDSDCILFDTDTASPRDLFKFADHIFLVQDMDYFNILENSTFLFSLKESCVNLKKLVIILNKFLDCQVNAREMKDWLCFRQGYDNTGEPERLLDNPKVIKAPFVLKDYITDTAREFEGIDSGSGYSLELSSAVDEICEFLYPCKKEKSGWMSRILA